MTRNHDLWIRAEGTGPDVLLLHSLALNSRGWSPIVSRYRDTFRSIRVDFPGHGKSGWDGQPLSVSDLADTAIAAMDANGLAKAHVIGVSLGGSVAMDLALRHPERVDRLVLADCSANYGPDRVANWEERARGAVSKPRHEQFAHSCGRWFSDAFIAEHPEVISTFEDMFIECDSAAHAATCRALGGFDVLDELGRLEAPTRVIVGSDDPGTPVNIATDIASRIRSADLTVVPGVKHMALFEELAVWDTILAHLQVPT